MAKSGYLPKSDAGKAISLRNFAMKLPSHAAVLGLTPAEVASVAADSAMFSYLLKAQEEYKTFKQGLSQYKDSARDGPISAPLGAVPVAPVLLPPPAPVQAGIFPRLSRLVLYIKHSPGYSESIGEDLGIVGAEHVVDIAGMKPFLKSRSASGKPVIIWKKGRAKSIDIYVDRKDGKGFVFLATDMFPDYLDNCPMPAGIDSVVWDYRAIYRINDKQVGQFSEPISVTVTKVPG